MKFFKGNLNGILFCLLEALAGVLLLINPVSFTSGIIMAVGIVLIFLGIIEVVSYFRTSAEEACLEQSLAKGLIMLVSGFFCVLETQWFIATFPILTVIYGICVLIAGLSKVQLCADMLRLKNKKWFLAAVSAAISVVCAVVILKNPFATTAILWIFIGISLIVEAIFDIIILILGRKSAKG